MALKSENQSVAPSFVAIVVALVLVFACSAPGAKAFDDAAAETQSQQFVLVQPAHLFGHGAEVELEEEDPSLYGRLRAVRVAYLGANRCKQRIRPFLLKLVERDPRPD